MKILGSCVLLSLPFTVFAQVEGSLTGSVVDTYGGSGADAALKLLLSESNVTLAATASTWDVLFSVPGIRPGFYDLHVTAAGFREYSLRGVKGDTVRETSLPPLTLAVESLPI